MPTIRELAEEHAAACKTADVFATIDPEAAFNNRPCLLVGPPTIDLVNRAGPLTTWRVYALTSRSRGDVDALDEFVPLIDAAMAALPIERAEPASYQLAPGADPVPCYLLTFTS